MPATEPGGVWLSRMGFPERLQGQAGYQRDHPLTVREMNSRPPGYPEHGVDSGRIWGPR